MDNEDFESLKEKLIYHTNNHIDTEVCLQMFLILELQEINHTLYNIELNLGKLK